MASYVITGCSRGIGLSLATQLAALPSSQVSNVFATARSESDSLKALIAKSSGRVVFIPLETTDAASVASAVTAVESKLGEKGLDVLINNAGICVWSSNEGITKMPDLSDHLNTNVVGVQLVTAGFMPLLEKGNLKKIANISTNLGSIANAHTYKPHGCHAYTISKAALNMLTVQYALDYEKEGFTIFAISPGWLKTDLGSAYADLDVDVGVKATLDRIFSAGEDQNGKHLNILVPGYEKTAGPNQYDGLDLPW